MASSSGRRRVPVVTVLLGLLATLTACGVGAEATPAGSADASPVAEVSSGEVAGGGETAAATVAPRPSRSTAAAEAFVRFATGGPGADVPWAPRVTYRIAGTDVATLRAAEAVRRSAWRGCPAGEQTYEGRDCPVTPLRSLTGVDPDGTTLVVEPGWPRVVGCSRVDARPAARAGAVAVRPPVQRRDCFSDVAVLLQVDDAGRIDLVDLVLSGS